MLRNKPLKKIMCAALAGVSVFASVAMFSSCTTSHPEVEMKLSFNDKSYTLQYKLYRKIAPSTVQHFLELVENGYYDGLCIHNYDAGTSRLYTGGYSYDASKADDGGLVEKDYFSVVKDWTLTQTVWDDEARTDPLYTVYGEFPANGFEVENGAVKQSYGSLTMYYTPKESCSVPVYVQRADGKGYNSKPYKYNSATSLFYISTGSSNSVSSSYCTFATLKDDDSTDKLKELMTAIEEYIADEYEETADFAPSVTVTVDEEDRYMAAAREKQTYKVPNTPITVEYIKVKSY